MRTVLISDTHTKHDYYKIPDGDLLIHAGDMTNIGSRPDLDNFISWFKLHPHKYKVFIAGNHDFIFERESFGMHDFGEDIHYLQDSVVQLGGLTIYGSPWQPWFHDWAFNLKRGKALAEKWAMIPQNTDILITHGPPFEILDWARYGSENTGCVDLLARVKEVKPKLHVFGHIHESYGTKKEGPTWFVNASSLDDKYRPVHDPIVFDYINGQFEPVNKS